MNWRSLWKRKRDFANNSGRRG